MKKLITVLFGLMIAGIQAQSPVENRESVKKDLLQNITTPLSGSNISIKEADEALAFHNQARKEVAVEPLLWSAEISGYAQEWANNLAKKRLPASASIFRRKHQRLWRKHCFATIIFWLCNGCF